jgi:tetratricopeptide (TPR) repeat protein
MVKKAIGDAIKLLDTNYVEIGPITNLKRDLSEQGYLNKQESPPQVSAAQWRSDTEERKNFFLGHLIQKERFDDAKEFAETALFGGTLPTDSSGKYGQPLYYWMLALYRSEKTTPEEAKEALVAFERSRDCVGANIDGVTRYSVAAGLAIRANDFKKASDYWDKAIQANPANLETWLNKAVTYLKAGDGQAAYALVKRIPSLYDGDDRLDHVKIASILATVEQLPGEVTFPPNSAGGNRSLTAA